MNLLRIVTRKEEVSLDKPSKWTKLVEYKEAALAERREIQATFNTDSGSVPEQELQALKTKSAGYLADAFYYFK